MGEGIVAYNVHVEKIDGMGTARTATRDPAVVEHISLAWPEELTVWAYSYEYVHYKVYKKNTSADCCWGTYWIINTLYGYSGWHNIDGPHKCKLWIEYDKNAGTAEQSYDYRWYDAESNSSYK